MSPPCRRRPRARGQWLSRPSKARSPCLGLFLRLVEESAALEHARAFLGGDFDVARRQKEDLVGDALHATVERVRQAAREIDEPLRQLLVGALEVEDDR